MKPGLAKKYLEKTRQDYKLIASEFSETRFLPWQEMIDLANMYVKEGYSVLDLGCGNGRLYEAFQGRKVNYLGVDPIKELLEKARVKFPQAKFLRGDALDIHFLSEQKFDSVFFIAVLHQIPSRELQLRALNNIKAVLKPGGHLIMENWNLMQPRYWQYWLIKYFVDPALPFKDLLIPWKSYHKGPKGLFKSQINKPVWRYYHAFTLKELASLVKAAGLKLTEQYYVREGQKVNPFQGFNIVTVARK